MKFSLFIGGRDEGFPSPVIAPGVADLGHRWGTNPKPPAAIEAAFCWASKT
jgi:hypothetical protein